MHIIIRDLALCLALVLAVASCCPPVLLLAKVPSFALAIAPFRLQLRNT